MSIKISQLINDPGPIPRPYNPHNLETILEYGTQMRYQNENTRSWFQRCLNHLVLQVGDSCNTRGELQYLSWLYLTAKQKVNLRSLKTSSNGKFEYYCKQCSQNTGIKNSIFAGKPDSAHEEEKWYIVSLQHTPTHSIRTLYEDSARKRCGYIFDLLQTVIEHERKMTIRSNTDTKDTVIYILQDIYFGKVCGREVNHYSYVDIADGFRIKEKRCSSTEYSELEKNRSQFARMVKRVVHEESNSGIIM